MKKFLILLFCIYSLLPLYAAESSVEEILTKFRTTLHFPNLSGSIKVEMISKKGDIREVEAKAFQKEVSNNQLNLLFLFNYPPTVRDTGLLLHTYFNGDENNMWIYLPAVKRIKRIALEQSGGGYFMGSDFTYSDFIMKTHEEYTREYLGEEQIDGVSCFVVKDWVEDLERRQEIGYGYTINYYNQSDYHLQGRDYYDLSGHLLKVYRVKDILKYNGSIYPTKIVMHNVQTDHKSILEFYDYNTDEIPENIFTTRYLRNR